ncbi:hypothetical protein OUZ56_001995 [Daphnia magna]|uniref:Uncharacterized protein n=1 Tax=Daphnia magna TaxID=35525 RepID=A0ABR0A4D5_9CRUS|nr:hypothetical protein OUZ56_001995 [Daphnia magna]
MEDGGERGGTLDELEGGNEIAARRVSHKQSGSPIFIGPWFNVFARSTAICSLTFLADRVNLAPPKKTDRTTSTSEGNREGRDEGTRPLWSSSAWLADEIVRDLVESLFQQRNQKPL